MPRPIGGICGGCSPDCGLLIVSSTDRIMQAASQAACSALILMIGGSQTHASRLSATVSLLMSTPYQMLPVEVICVEHLNICILLTIRKRKMRMWYHGFLFIGKLYNYVDFGVRITERIFRISKMLLADTIQSVPAIANNWISISYAQFRNLSEKQTRFDAGSMSTQMWWGESCFVLSIGICFAQRRTQLCI